MGCKGREVCAAVIGAGAGVIAMLLWQRRRGSEEGRESRQRYEQDEVARQYLEFHYTPSKVSFSQSLGSIEEAFDFPQRIARRCIEFAGARGRALDLGCASGASAFVLSAAFAEVVGVDLSAALIRDAQRVQREGNVEFRAVEQGRRSVARTAKPPAGAQPARCKFCVGDALRLDPSLGTFDCVLAANLVCRVPDPEELFASVRRVLRKGGTLVLISPYSWYEGASPAARWVGGQEDSLPSEVLVKKRLVEIGFVLLHEGTEPFVLRDHVRRYQLGFSHCTVWRAGDVPVGTI